MTRNEQISLALSAMESSLNWDVYTQAVAKLIDACRLPEDSSARIAELEAKLAEAEKLYEELNTKYLFFQRDCALADAERQQRGRKVVEMLEECVKILTPYEAPGYSPFLKELLTKLTSVTTEARLAFGLDAADKRCTCGLDDYSTRSKHDSTCPLAEPSRPTYTPGKAGTHDNPLDKRCDDCGCRFGDHQAIDGVPCKCGKCQGYYRMGSLTEEGIPSNMLIVDDNDGSPRYVYRIVASPGTPKAYTHTSIGYNTDYLAGYASRHSHASDTLPICCGKAVR